MAAITCGSLNLLMAAYKAAVNQNLAAGVDIVNNDQGSGSTEVCFFWEKDKAKSRLYGKAAKPMMRRSPDLTFNNLIRLIDIPGNQEEQINTE